jgi:hypothetical protein
MDLLLKKNRLGATVAGSDQKLLERARHGDDITLYEVSSAFSCYLVFANYVVSSDRVSGLSLPHMAHGEFANPAALGQTSLTTIRYIYDSLNNNLLCKDLLDDKCTITSIWANNPHYSSLAWYATRQYAARHFEDLISLKACGDQFKVRLELHQAFKLVLKPASVSCPESGKGFLIMSSAMILPTAFVLNPKRYVKHATPLIANKTFSLAYLTVGSDQTLTIVHKQRYSADESAHRALKRAIALSAPTARFEARQAIRPDPPAAITRLECDYAILVP